MHRYRNVLAFTENEICAWSRRQNVLAEVLQIDVLPETFRNAQGGLFADRGVAVEERVRIAECRFPKIHEAIDIPVVNETLVRINID